MRPGARSRRDGDGLASTPCVQAKCFDPLVRDCVACNLLRTPDPRPAAGLSSLAPGTALQPQESVSAGAGAGAETALQLPALLLGAPALLGLALALVLVALVSWRRRQRRLSSPGLPEASDIEQDEPPNCVTILSSGPLDATAPIWPSPREDPATTPPAHSVPVPATELGSTELVTTKTAGPEQ
ncbi:tumor necrosis factor receptor superfamily member 13C isoform X1 [Rhinolophus ferrumequinum]|uniref:TNF receptor superfamily member 13C n=1 Tax=Rhinolophus ferrumequinum TaxID=59479 RepID=A0A671FFE2_RHIFE|nr:tumor necrosis factor receptor superfamily member 13C isoform X1 [Rhinolophus ferrumequinum]